MYESCLAPSFNGKYAVDNIEYESYFSYNLFYAIKIVFNLFSSNPCIIGSFSSRHRSSQVSSIKLMVSGFGYNRFVCLMNNQLVLKARPCRHDCHKENPRPSYDNCCNHISCSQYPVICSLE